MSGKREDVPASRTNTDSNIGFSFEELETELRKLYINSHPEREQGEFTISEYAKVNHLTMQQAENDLEYKTRQGHLIKIPEKKYIDFKLRTVYKMLPKKQDHL